MGRHGPHSGASSQLKHMCMRVLLPPSLSRIGTCALALFLTLGHARCDPLSRMQLGLSRIGACAPCSFSCIEVRAVFPVSRMQLVGPEDAWGAVGGGVGHSSSRRRRRVFRKKINKRRRGAHQAQQHAWASGRAGPSGCLGASIALYSITPAFFLFSFLFHLFL
jgi:hypothetical protein